MSDGDITDILDARDRILMAAWMLPNNGPLSDTQRKQAMQNFTTYIRRHGLTPTEVGHAAGRSSLS